MGVVPFFSKFIGETFVISLDFTDEMPESTTLSSGVCSAINRKTEASATADILSAGTTPTIDSGNNLAKISITGGTSGYWYEVHFLMTLSNASVLKGKAVLFVE